MPINNRYELLDKIGTGGMGEVYRAHDRLTNDIIALKRVLVKPDTLNFNSRTTDTNLSLALAHEFRALASLRHPHIISVLDYGFDEQHVPYFTMEYLLNAHSILNPKIDVNTVAKINLLIQLLQGLDYLHRRGLIHRDLKPANIMIHNEEVKIIDFGLAIELDQAQGVSGTITYLAPEQFQGARPSVASDLYAVGLLAYQLFLREYPFDTSQPVNALISDIIEKTIDTSDLPTNIVPVIQRLLYKEPDQRYNSASDTIQALSDAIHQDLPPETTVIRESYLQASTFVGRAPELDILQSALTKILVGDNVFYLVGGESGVGKSRLVEELRTLALVEGVQVWRGQGVEGGGLSFQAWRNIARRLLLSVDVDDLSASILKDIVPDIATLLQRDVSDAPLLRGNAHQKRLVKTLVELLGEVDLPLLLILEDLQWTNESLLPLQQLLSTQIQYSNLMVVGTYRNDEHPNLPDMLGGIDVLVLPRLDDSAILQLSTAMLGQAGQRPEVINLLTQETEGNTFFMVEVVRTLAEEAGRIHEIGQHTLPEHVFTGGMQRLLKRRLAKISPKHQYLLQLTAVAGRQIDEEILHYVHPNPEEIKEFIYQAELAAVLEIQENKWQFAHDKLREAVLQDVDTVFLPQFHKKIATAIETIYPDDDGYHEILYQHWQIADDFDKEIYYLQFILPKLVEISAQYERARHILNVVLPRIAENDERRIPFLRQLSLSYERQGYYVQAEQIAHQVYKLAKLTQNHEWLALSLHDLGFTTYRQVKYGEAKRYAEQSLAIYEELNDIYGMARNLNTLGIIELDQKNYDEAKLYQLQCLKYRQILKDERGIASALANLGIIATSQNRYEEAVDYYESSILTAHHIGDKWSYANVVMEYGYLKLKMNQDARSKFVEAIQILQDIQVNSITLECLIGYAMTLLKEDKSYRAAQLVGLVQNHPDCVVYVQVRVDELLIELAEILSNQELNQAQLESSQLTLALVIEEILLETS